MPNPDTFWNRIDIGKADECWRFAGACTRQGYGQVKWQGKTQLAHRVAFLLTHSRWPQPNAVHVPECRLAACCNPAHLIEGSQQTVVDNTQQRGTWNFDSRFWQLRKTHCPQGHPYDAQYSDGRRCRTCFNAHARDRYQTKKSA